MVNYNLFQDKNFKYSKKDIGILILIFFSSVYSYFALPFLIFYLAKITLKAAKKNLLLTCIIFIITGFIWIISWQSLLARNGFIKTYNLQELYFLTFLGVFLIDKDFIGKLLAKTYYLNLLLLAIGLISSSCYLLLYGRTGMLATESWDDWYFFAGGINGLYYSLAIIGPLHLSNLKTLKVTHFLLHFFFTTILGTLISGNHQKAVIISTIVYLFFLFLLKRNIKNYVTPLFLVIIFILVIVLINSGFLDTFGGIRYDEYLDLLHKTRSLLSISTESTYVRIYDIYGTKILITSIFCVFLLALLTAIKLEKLYELRRLSLNVALFYYGLTNFIFLSFFSSSFFILSIPCTFFGWYYLLNNLNFRKIRKKLL